MTTMAEQTLRSSEPNLADRFVGGRYVRLVLVLGALSEIGPLTINK